MFSKATQLAPTDELESSELNRLLLGIKQHPAFKNDVVAEGVLIFEKNNGGYARPLKYFVLERTYAVGDTVGEENHEITTRKKRIIVFDVTKDLDDETNTPYLYAISNIFAPQLSSKDETERVPPSCGDDSSFYRNPYYQEDKESLLNGLKTLTYQETVDFLNEEKKNKSIFLMPVQQCGTYFPPLNFDLLHKRHIVLSIYDGSTNEICVHDSQGGIPILDLVTNFALSSLIYPDKLGEVRDYAYKGIVMHGNQQGPHQCGYYVHNFVISYLYEGDTTQFEKMRVLPDLIKNKKNYLRNWLKIVKKMNPSISDEWLILNASGETESESPVEESQTTSSEFKTISNESEVTSNPIAVTSEEAPTTSKTTSDALLEESASRRSMSPIVFSPLYFYFKPPTLDEGEYKLPKIYAKGMSARAFRLFTPEPSTPTDLEKATGLNPRAHRGLGVALGKGESE